MTNLSWKDKSTKLTMINKMKDKISALAKGMEKCHKNPKLQKRLKKLYISNKNKTLIKTTTSPTPSTSTISYMSTKSLKATLDP